MEKVKGRLLSCSQLRMKSVCVCVFVILLTRGRMEKKKRNLGFNL